MAPPQGEAQRQNVNTIFYGFLNQFGNGTIMADQKAVKVRRKRRFMGKESLMPGGASEPRGVIGLVRTKK